MTADLVVWLRTQLDTDERLGEDDPGGMCDGGVHLDRDFWLRQVQAHRAILDEHARSEVDSCAICLTGMWSGEWQRFPCNTIKALVSIYSDRDGYKEEWSA